MARKVNGQALPVAPVAPTAPAAAPRFNEKTIQEHSSRLWALGYDGWDSSDESPRVFAAALGRALTSDERSAVVRCFRHVVYGTTDGSLRRVKGARESSKSRYEALGSASGLAAAFTRAFGMVLDGTPVAPPASK